MMDRIKLLLPDDDDGSTGAGGAASGGSVISVGTNAGVDESTVAGFRSGSSVVVVIVALSVGEEVPVVSTTVSIASVGAAVIGISVVAKILGDMDGASIGEKEEDELTSGGGTMILTGRSSSSS